MSKKLTFSIPPAVATALHRRHHGREDITRDEILDAMAKMNILWSQYVKVKEKWLYCMGEWWDKMEIEKHFGESRWYYAHRKVRALEAKKKELHKAMFYLLVYTDGNPESFDSTSMYADDIYADFMSKYKARL